MDRFMLVTGFPKASETDKLVKLSEKMFKNIRKDYCAGLVREQFLEDSENKPLSVLLLEYEDVESCIKGYNIFDNLEASMGKLSLTFTSFFLRDTARFARLQEFEAREYASPRQLQEYKGDEWFRSQLLAFAGSELHLSWFHHLVKALDPALARPARVAGARQLAWSRQGSFVLVLLKNELELRGGRELALIQTYLHEGVLRALFSEDEKYILSFNGTIAAPNFENYIVWDTLTGTRLRAFRAFQDQPWGALQFEPHSKFLSCFSEREGRVSVYQLPAVQLCASYALKDFKQVQWFSKGGKSFLVNYCFSTDHKRQRTNSISVYSIRPPAKEEGEEDRATYR